MEMNESVNEMLGRIDEEREVERYAGRAEAADSAFCKRYAQSKKPVSEIREEAKRRGVTGTQIAMELKEAGLPVPKFYSDEMIEAQKIYGKRGADKVHGVTADKPKAAEPVKEAKQEPQTVKEEKPETDGKKVYVKPEIEEKKAEDVTTAAKKEPEKVPEVVAERMKEETKVTVLWAITEELKKLLHERDEAQDRIDAIDKLLDKLNRAYLEVEGA